MRAAAGGESEARRAARGGHRDTADGAADGAGAVGVCRADRSVCGCSGPQNYLSHGGCRLPYHAGATLPTTNHVRSLSVVSSRFRVKHPFQEVGAKRGATRERCLTTLRGRLRSARCAHVGWVVAQTTRDCERKMEAVRLAHRKDVDDLETKLQLMRDQHLADLAEAEAEVRPLTLDRRWLAGPHPASPALPPAGATRY